MKKNTNQSRGKLELGRQTISNLPGEEMNKIRAGACEPCWENLWTLYHCNVVFTGESE